MKILVAYVVVTGGPVAANYAARFVSTYHENPPGLAHDTLIICNGGPLPLDEALIFSSLHPIFLPRVNDPGWDISAFIDVARGAGSNYDAIFCCGESVHFHRQGWLARLVSAWERHGPGMYGPLSSNTIRGHLNTTAFLCPPSLLAKYPSAVFDRKSRYEFEHGERSFWRRLSMKNIPVRLVTWDGEWTPKTWRVPANILWRGDQSNCLVWECHTENWLHSDLGTKQNWSRMADAQFR